MQIKQFITITIATQPFLVSSRNAPPHNDNDVTTLKTAVWQTNVWDEENKIHRSTHRHFLGYLEYF